MRRRTIREPLAGGNRGHSRSLAAPWSARSAALACMIGLISKLAAGSVPVTPFFEEARVRGYEYPDSAQLSLNGCRACLGTCAGLKEPMRGDQGDDADGVPDNVNEVELGA